MKLKPNNKCCLCLKNIDYIEHFFFDCNTINKFWRYIEHFIEKKTGIRPKLGIQEVLLSYENPQHKTVHNIINHIILIGKMCISIFRKTEHKDLFLNVTAIFKNSLCFKL